MSPFDRLEALYVLQVVALFGGVVLFIWLKRALVRLLLWMDRRGWIKYLGDAEVPSYGTLARGFLVFHQALEPHKRYVLEAKTQERAEQDDEGGPDRAGRSQGRS